MPDNITQVKIVLQGKDEPFFEYEERLNAMLLELQSAHKKGGVLANVNGTASHDGRMCCIVNYINQ